MLTPYEERLRRKELAQELDINLLRIQESFEQVSAVSESIDELTLKHGPVQELKTSAFLIDEVSVQIYRSLNNLSKRLNVLKYYNPKPCQETTT